MIVWSVLKMLNLPVTIEVCWQYTTSILELKENKMTAYFVANYKITDAEGIAKYREAVIPQLLKANCEFLVVNDDVEVMEGTPDPTLIVLKFETGEAAKKWFNSVEYQSIKGLRLNASADGWAALSEGFKMPDSE